MIEALQMPDLSTPPLFPRESAAQGLWRRVATGVDTAALLAAQRVINTFSRMRFRMYEASARRWACSNAVKPSAGRAHHQRPHGRHATEHTWPHELIRWN